MEGTDDSDIGSSGGDNATWSGEQGSPCGKPRHKHAGQAPLGRPRRVPEDGYRRNPENHRRYYARKKALVSATLLVHGRKPKVFVVRKQTCMCPNCQAVCKGTSAQCVACVPTACGSVCSTHARLAMQPSAHTARHTYKRPRSPSNTLNLQLADLAAELEAKQGMVANLSAQNQQLHNREKVCRRPTMRLPCQLAMGTQRLCCVCYMCMQRRVRLVPEQASAN